MSVRSGSSPDPRSLSARVAAHAPGAFDELHDRYEPRLRVLFTRRLGRAGHLVDDLVQQTWTALWRSLADGRYDPNRAAISTFVYAIAHNVWLQHCRTINRPGPGTDPERVAGPPDQVIAGAELLEALQDCVERAGLLDDEERAVVLSTAQGETERVLAARLGLAASTINARKRSAYQKLRRCLGMRGIGPEMIEQIAGLLE